MADEWEESIVCLELCGVTGSQLFPSEGGRQQVEILGLASEQPLLQINGHTFAGHYEDTVGTHLFMAGNKEHPATATGTDGSKSSTQSVNWDYLCKSDKKLVMKPAFLVEKQQPESATAPATSGSAPSAGHVAAPAAVEPPAESILVPEDPAEAAAT